MALNSLRLPFIRTFDTMRRFLGRPALYAIPWQTPSGATYRAEFDNWLDGDDEVVSKTPAELTYYAIPALWGADAEALLLSLGGMGRTGDLVGIAKAEYSAQLDGAMMVVTGSLSGKRYNVAGVENAPDGGSDNIFVVVQLNRRE